MSTALFSCNLSHSVKLVEDCSTIYPKALSGRFESSRTVAHVRVPNIATRGKMRLRVRGPSGSTVLNLEPGSTVGELRTRITEATSVTQPDIKIGYPPRPLLLKEDSMLLSELGMKLDGEQLIVSQNNGTSGELSNDRAKIGQPNPHSSDAKSSQSSWYRKQPTSTESQPSSFSFTDVGIAPQTPPRANVGRGNHNPPLSLTRKPTTAADEPPEVPLPSHSSTLTLRIMPDDNSCLFRAFNSAFFGAMDNMQELRSIIAQTIQSQSDKYPSVVLEQDPDDYCRWIQSADACKYI